VKTMLALFTALVCCQPSMSDDWKQWSGNTRDDRWTEEGILDKFPEGGLKPTWTVPIGSGYASPVVSKGRIFVTDFRPKKDTRTLEAIERMLCLDEETGKKTNTEAETSPARKAT